jgi:unsaturated rhamnogalacturonyl hydrolase
MYVVRMLFALSICGMFLGGGQLAAVGQHLPTPEQQKRIEYDNVTKHNGDQPENPGSLATDLDSSIDPAAVDSAMRKVADWEIARAQPYFGDTWEWSVLYTGVMAAANSLHDPKYLETMNAVGQKFDWKLRSHLPNADDQSIAQMYSEIYMQKHDPKMIANTREELDALIEAEDQPATRIPWWWCDALYMGPPVWVRTYAITHERKYLDYIDREWWKTSSLLYDEKEHLYFRDAAYLRKTEPNGQKMFWSRGNGWVMGGLVRTLEFMPADDPMRARYVEQFRQMAERVAGLQSSDGLWRSGLLDADYYVLPENSGSALFTYALAWGVNHGLLSRKRYERVVERGWDGLVKHIYADGRIGCMQQTGAEPAFYLPSASYNFGVGAFLLAGSEVRQLKHSHRL